MSWRDSIFEPELSKDASNKASDTIRRITKRVMQLCREHEMLEKMHQHFLKHVKTPHFEQVYKNTKSLKKVKTTYGEKKILENIKGHHP